MRHDHQRFLAVIALTGAVLAGCSSSDDRSSDTTTTVRSGGSGDATTTTAAPASTSVASDDSALEGTWNADARDLLAANTANVGTPTGLNCSGPATLTFNADGTFQNGGQVTCSLSTMTGTGQFTSTGRYSVSGTTLTITDAQTSGQLQVGPANVPFSPGLNNGSATFVIDGSTLRLSFDGGSAGQLTQTWTR